MKQRINLVTLGVNDLNKSMEFYQKMGWQTNGIVGTEYENGAVVMFELGSSMMLCLYERKNLAWDSNVALQPASATEFSLGYFVNSQEEVDTVMDRAKKAGANISKPASEAFWGGYNGYFQDLDGHLWEVGYNPSWKVEE
jgi:hypothetical protein